ncbi:hypothetical protein SEA_ROMAN_54 [Microbacterium phage Roman]|nr:hypothetical protein SEA_ROMAN_54 [Microbacterium phage Roman]
MKRPKLVLPSLSMPWGRWVEGELDSTSTGLDRQLQDSSSVGNLFASRSDLIQSQIGSIPSVAAVYERLIPPFSVTRSSTGAVAYVYPTPLQVFNPPRPDLPYNYTVIASMDVSGVELPFCYSMLRANGRDDMYQHENLQPGYLTRGTFSISGSGSIGPGDTVRAEAAIAASATGTLNFNSAKMWCVFSGSIL